MPDAEGQCRTSYTTDTQQLSQARNGSFQPRHHARPAIAHCLIARLVLRPETGVLHSHECAALHCSERPGHHRLQTVLRLLARGVLAPGQPFIRLDDQLLAVSDAITT